MGTGRKAALGVAWVASFFMMASDHEDLADFWMNGAAGLVFLYINAVFDGRFSHKETNEKNDNLKS